MPDLFITVEQAEADMLACAAFIAERIKSGDGHAEAMRMVLPRYLARNEVDLAAELANAIDDPFSRDRLLTIVAEKCSEIDDYEYALQLAEAIEDGGQRAEAQERIGLILAGNGKTEEAAELAAEMSHPDFVLAGIAVRLMAEGNTTSGSETLDSIAFPAARVLALQQIAADQIDAKKAGPAVKTLESAAETALDIEHDEEQIRKLCEISDLFVSAKRRDKAIEIYEKARGSAELLDNMHRDYFLATCAIGFLNAGSKELTERTLDLITDKTHMASALLGIARDQWKKGEKEDAMDTLDEAYEILRSQRDIETRDSRARNVLMASIATQFAGFGKAERASAAAQENQDIDEQTNALSQIAGILTMQRQDELARQAMETIPDDAGRLFALIHVADAKEKLDGPSAAIAMLDEATSMTETVPQLAMRSSLLNELAVRYGNHDLQEKAHELALSSLDIISEIRDESSKAAALASLSDVYVHLGADLGNEEMRILRHMVSAVAR